MIRHQMYILAVILHAGVATAAEHGTASAKPDRDDFITYIFNPINIRSRGPGKAPDFVGANAPAKSGVEAHLRVLETGRDKKDGRSYLVCESIPGNDDLFDSSIPVIVDAPPAEVSEAKNLVGKDVFFVLEPAGSSRVSSPKGETINLPLFRVAEICDDNAFEKCRAVKK